MTLRNPLDPEPPVWRETVGRGFACIEKIRVLNENLQELRDLALAALEDGLLISCDEEQLRNTMHAMIDALHTDYQPQRCQLIELAPTSSLLRPDSAPSA